MQRDVHFRQLDELPDVFDSLVDLDFPTSDECFRPCAWNHRPNDDRHRNDVEHLRKTSTTALQGNCFGFVQSGTCVLTADQGRFPLTAGMYFSAHGPLSIAGTSAGVLLFQERYQGLFQIGGPVETAGRLKYIDGCSDTLLISPVVKGDACLNFLHLPPGTNQTAHTHPSFRFGVVVQGRGFCDSDSGTERLQAGTVFYIAANGQHRFRTDDEGLTVIAFHPDSDFGPEDDNHPMVNKTIIDGVAAAALSHSQRRIER